MTDKIDIFVALFILFRSFSFSSILVGMRIETRQPFAILFALASGFNLWNTDTPAPCRVRCPTRVRVSVRHRHNTRTTFYILDIIGVYVFVSMSCSVSMSVSVLHRTQLISFIFLSHWFGTWGLWWRWLWLRNKVSNNIEFCRIQLWILKNYFHCTFEIVIVL